MTARRLLVRSAAGLAALLFAAAPVPAQIPAGGPEPGAYREHDYGGFNDVLPPGANGRANAAELAAFAATGARPAHNDDQLRMYADLVHVAPGLTPDRLRDFFKDASFGVRPGDAERRYSPRDDVTIVRDAGFGVPHVYGSTRDGAMFGLGYAAAEDRLFLMDVLRHVGRARLSSFAGGSAGNREQDRQQWAVAPYTEADLQRQVDRFDDLYGSDGAQVQRDASNYVAGVNAYIAEARLNPTKMPGEYAAFGRPLGPEPWKETDIIATAALVGGIFGKGGGSELDDALLLETMRAKLGHERGTKVFYDLASFEDPEAPTTVHDGTFEYDARPADPQGLAMPDPDSVERESIVAAGDSGSAGDRNGVFGLPFSLPGAFSNALLVSGAESASGRPIAVFGPQTGYFSPQLLMEQDVHAPATAAGPGIDARGAAFAGTNLYVQLGRGRDYAWSATSAGQDIIDTYAVELCEPGGSQPTKRSNHYRFRGECLAMEELRRENCWEPSAADQTPAGCETLVVRRTKLGLVTARATLDGIPVAYTKLRRTYFHEIDSAMGFMDFNDPAKITSVGDFQRAAHRILYTFNWFYADDRDIGYFNSGANPVRPPGVDGNMPTRGADPYLWQGFDADANTADITPFEEHPQVVDQAFLTSWNNKQARAYRASGFGGFPSVHRVDPLDLRIRRGIEGEGRMSLVDLVNAMGDAATVDLRGEQVLPWLLRAVGDGDGRTRGAIRKLSAWMAHGAHRRDRDRDGRYEHADAIRIMDAWWPLLLQAQFRPALGGDVFDAVRARQAFDDHNRDDHVGSAFQSGWYGWVEKDLRTLLGEPVAGGYSEVFCGRGDLAACRRALLDALAQAAKTPAGELYADDLCPSDEIPDPQMCDEAIRHVPAGGITQPLIHWVNRPTYQQAVEVEGHRGR
jgi:acyl-homoserine lactone acylase PvdQ